MARGKKISVENAAEGVRFASQKRASDLQPYIKKLLTALGKPDSILLSDTAAFADFLPPRRRRQTTQVQSKIKRELGIDIVPSDYVVDAAEKLFQRSLN